MLTINQEGKDVIIKIKGDFNLIIIRENSEDTDIKPKYPKIIDHLPKDKKGFINYQELPLNLVKTISLILYCAYVKKELTEEEYDIIDTHLLNYIKKNL